MGKRMRVIFPVMKIEELHACVIDEVYIRQWAIIY